MILPEYTTSAIYFDGDFVIENNDLKVVTGTLNVRILALKDFLRTQYNDYAFYPYLGSNLDIFVGKGIDENLRSSFERYLESAIIRSDLFAQGEFKVYSYIQQDILVYRIVVIEAPSEIIEVTYKTSTGVTIE